MAVQLERRRFTSNEQPVVDTIQTSHGLEVAAMPVSIDGVMFVAFATQSDDNMLLTKWPMDDNIFNDGQPNRYRKYNLLTGSVSLFAKIIEPDIK